MCERLCEEILEGMCMRQRIHIVITHIIYFSVSLLIASIFYFLITGLMFFNILYMLVFLFCMLVFYFVYSVLLYCFFYFFSFCIYSFSFFHVHRPLPPAGNTIAVNPYPTAFPYGNGMVLHFYQQQESSTTKTVHKVINKGLKTYV